MTGGKRAVVEIQRGFGKQWNKYCRDEGPTLNTFTSIYSFGEIKRFTGVKQWGNLCASSIISIKKKGKGGQGAREINL